MLGGAQPECGVRKWGGQTEGWQSLRLARKAVAMRSGTVERCREGGGWMALFLSSHPLDPLLLSFWLSSGLMGAVHLLREKR